MVERAAVPRGRHAPPLEVRQTVQRDRLFEAAAAVFARAGYADASAEAIAREAGMSKATFYEHFANKEECILALFDVAAGRTLEAMAEATSSAGTDSAARMKAGAKAFLEMLAEHPNESQTLLVEIIGAGDRGADRRDNILAAFAQAIDTENANAARKGSMRRFASPDDAYAIVGAVVELASRQLRRGVPAAWRGPEPLVERLFFGLAPVE